MAHRRGLPTLAAGAAIDAGLAFATSAATANVTAPGTPGASPTSTQAAYASRNYAIAPTGAWSQRVEVQGFAPPVWKDAAGNGVGIALHLWPRKHPASNRAVTDFWLRG